MKRQPPVSIERLLFETFLCYSVAVLTPAPPFAAVNSVEDFKLRTREKLKDVTCPVHRQPPRIRFEGSTLHDVRLSLSSCCERLAVIANKAIAS